MNAADILKHLNLAAEKIKDLISERDACLKRAQRAEHKCADQKAEHERELSKARNERDKLLKIIERKGTQ